MIMSTSLPAKEALVLGVSVASAGVSRNTALYATTRCCLEVGTWFGVGDAAPGVGGSGCVSSGGRRGGGWTL